MHLYADYLADVEDLRVVVLQLQRRGFEVQALVGHSRGANVVLMYASVFNTPEDFIPHVISISARHNMTQGHLKHSMDDLHNLIIHGGFDWHFKFKGQPMSIRITEKEMRRFYHMDMDMVRGISARTKVLLIHGSGDVTVPPYNAKRLSANISTSEIRYLKEADHFYSKGHKQGIVEMIKAYVEEMYATEGLKCPDGINQSLFQVDWDFVAVDPDEGSEITFPAKL